MSRLINEYEVNRAFFNAKQRFTSDEFYKDPFPADYTTKDIADYVLEQMEIVRKEIVGVKKNEG